GEAGEEAAQEAREEAAQAGEAPQEGVGEAPALAGEGEAQGEEARGSAQEEAREGPRQDRTRQACGVAAREAEGATAREAASSPRPPQGDGAGRRAALDVVAAPLGAGAPDGSVTPESRVVHPGGTRPVARVPPSAPPLVSRHRTAS